MQQQSPAASKVDKFKQAVDRVLAARTLYGVLGVKRTHSHKTRHADLRTQRRNTLFAFHTDKKLFTDEERAKEIRNLIDFGFDILNNNITRRKYNMLLDTRPEKVTFDVKTVNGDVIRVMRRDITDVDIPTKPVPMPPRSFEKVSSLLRACDAFEDMLSDTRLLY